MVDRDLVHLLEQLFSVIWQRGDYPQAMESSLGIDFSSYGSLGYAYKEVNR